MTTELFALFELLVLIIVPFLIWAINKRLKEILNFQRHTFVLYAIERKVDDTVLKTMVANKTLHQEEANYISTMRNKEA